MKAGDLVRRSEAFSNPAAIEDWGLGLIESVSTAHFSVEVVFPKKSLISNKIPWSRVEVVNESR